MTVKLEEKKTPAQPYKYDSMPYPNHTMSFISPEHIETIATVFGMNPPKVKTARVLELGCGPGLTSIAFGFRNPDAKVLGIDLSNVHIDHGKKYLEGLKINNVELKAASIMDIDKSFGEFDYIICHGVFSWVPSDVQKKIFEVIQKHLSPNGVAHVSYNALPGWNIAQTFRDMMQYHADMFSDEQDKIGQASAFIKFIDESLADLKTPHSKFLRQEAQIVASQGPSYLKHEYLDKGNSQFYFMDFMAAATTYGLQYLGDSSLPSMYLGNLPAKAFEELKVLDNIISSEQYMDFVTNRRFRNTLLCKAGVEINRNISPNIWNNMYLTSQLQSSMPIDQIKFDDENQSVTFAAVNIQASFNVTSSFLKAACVRIIENQGRFIHFDEIVSYVSKKLPNAKKDEIENVLKSSFTQLLFKNLLEIRVTPPHSISEISKKPKTSDLVRLQVSANETSLVNEYSNTSTLDLVQRLVLLYANGENTIDKIVELILSHVEKNELFINQNDVKVTDKETQKKLANEIVHNALMVLKNNYYLVA